MNMYAVTSSEVGSVVGRGKVPGIILCWVNLFVTHGILDMMLKSFCFVYFFFR